MLAFRRASLPLSNRTLGIRASSAARADLERLITQIQDQAGISDSWELASTRWMSFNGKHASTNVFLVRRGLASYAGAKSSGEDKDDLDDGFSELETEEDSVKAVSASNDESEDELISEPEFSEDDDVVESDASEKVPTKKRGNSALLRVITAAQGPSVAGALNKWVEDGNKIDREEISLTMLSLRKIRMYGKALQFSEWLESSKTVEFSDRDYSSRLDLIAKVLGLEKAEKYMDRIPESFRGELVYRTFLAGCVQAFNLKKAEEVFKKIKDEFTLTAFACNQMILLYKRTDNKQVADVLLLMEKENVKPSLFTYKMLIDIKGQHGDMIGMEQILETMKAEGVEPDTHTNCIVSRHYSSAGFKEKAEAVIKQMEWGDLKENRHVCRNIILLYAELGRADDVERVWKVCESNPFPGECLLAIEAWGKLKKIEKAEAVFEQLLKVARKPTSLHYNALLKVYSSNNLMTKGKDLIKRMADNGCQIGPVTWDLLVKLYVEAGEIGQADSMLQKAAQQNALRPLFTSYMTIMEQYAKRGDVHNTEKIFHRMREVGYQPRIRQFQTLIKAYVTAKAPLYGIRERMKANNFYPSKGLLGQLELVDAFRKTAVSDLLD